MKATVILKEVKNFKGPINNNNENMYTGFDHSLESLSFSSRRIQNIYFIHLGIIYYFNEIKCFDCVIHRYNIYTHKSPVSLQ